jgi:hypothetical protein
MTKAILFFVFFGLLFGILSGVQWSVSNSFPSPSSSWIEVKVNDQIVITTSLDANPRYFQVQVFDLVQVIYHMGIPMLAFMDDYTIYDHNGQVIVSEGQGNAIPQSMAQPMLITDPTVGTIYNITNDYYFLQPGQVIGFCDTGGYSGNYQDNEWFMNWFYAPPGYKLKVRFIEFSTEESCDYLRIYDGDYPNHSAFSSYSGSELGYGSEITSSSGPLTFRFLSDGSGTNSGWIAQISTVDYGLPGATSNTYPDNGSTVYSLSRNLYWNASAGAASYKVYCSASNPPAYHSTVTDCTALVAGLIPNTVYYWNVIPTNQCGDAPPTDTWSFLTYCPAPGTLSWSPVSGMAQLNWEAPASPPDHYVIYHNGSQLTTSTQNSCQVALPAYGSYATYYVTCVYGTVESEPGNSISVNGAAPLQWQLQLLCPDSSGWAWSYLTLSVDGLSVFEDLTLEAGISSQTFNFTVHHGDVISTLFEDYYSVNQNAAYRIIDNFGLPVVSVNCPNVYYYGGGSLANPIVVDENYYSRRILPINGTTTMDPGETIRFYDSGGAGNSYSNLESSQHIVYPPTGYRVKVDFDTVSISNWYEEDCLYVIDGAGEGSILASLEGELGACSYTSSTGPLTFNMVSDVNGTASGWSATLSLVENVPAAPVLSLPANAANGLGLNPTFSWAAGAGNAPSFYNLYLGTENPPTILVATLGGTNWTPGTALIPGTTYYWQVEAGNSGGVSLNNEIRSFSTLAGTPSGLSASSSLSSIDLNWTAATGNLNYYRIYRSTYDPPNEELAEVPSGQLHYTDYTAAGLDYYYQVRAVANDLPGNASNTVMVHLLPQLTVDPASFTLSVTNSELNPSCTFSISNTGGYPTSYTLSGSDLNGMHTTAPQIEGFVYLGEREGHGYYRSNSTMAWHAAKNLCENRGGHLITLNSAAEENFIYQKTAISEYGWTGYNDEQTEGIWTWVNGEAVSYTNWNAGEPNNGGWWGGNEDQCILRLDGSTGWNDAPAETPGYALLELDGFTYMGNQNGHRYYKSTSTMTWSQAKEQCEKRGGHLLTLNSAEENSYIYSLGSEQCWIGYTDEASEGTWTWVTGETSPYTAWYPGEPNNYNGNEDYAAWISGIGASWIDIDENHPFQAIMEIEPYDQSFVLSLGPSSGTLSPAASESITLSADGSALPDGVYHLSIRLQASDIQNAQFYPVTLNVNRAVVSAPSGLTFDTTLSHAEAIHISWAANNSTENITQYKVYRMNSGWTLIGTVPGSQTWFLDSNLGGLEGIIQYKVSAVNSLGMEGPASEVLNTWKLTFAPPENVVVNINPGGEIQISWTPVTQALCGSPASPNYYFIYAGSDPTAPESFARVAVVSGTQWQITVDSARCFYFVVSYSGAASYPDLEGARSKPRP